MRLPSPVQIFASHKGRSGRRGRVVRLAFVPRIDTLGSYVGEGRAMLDTMWAWLGDSSNRSVLTWIGGGLVVVAGGIWAVVKFFAKGGDDKRATPGVSADRGGVAVGRD